MVDIYPFSALDMNIRQIIYLYWLQYPPQHHPCYFNLLWYSANGKLCFTLLPDWVTVLFWILHHVWAKQVCYGCVSIFVDWITMICLLFPENRMYICHGIKEVVVYIIMYNLLGRPLQHTRMDRASLPFSLGTIDGGRCLYIYIYTYIYIYIVCKMP